MTFVDLFENGADELPDIRSVEIPLIQRDYAQGRRSPSVDKKRGKFLGVIHKAATGGEPISLDFIYGDVEEGTFQPLDGQQRLTTLFLLHWYLAFRTGRLPGEHAWGQFSYATRPSARRFCQRLMSDPPPPDGGAPSNWIRDQEWYLFTWDSDPTIQSMLTVIDAFDELFAEVDHEVVWGRLTDSENPSISFYLLPVEDMGSSDDLYIKMNSRGKPLTDFENFKARFERTLEEVHGDRAKEFAHKVDGDWADLLWEIHEGDNIVDDEFMRYLGFIVEMCEWTEGRWAVPGSLEERALQMFGAENENAAERLDFLFKAFDAWEGYSGVRETFERLFAAPGSGPENGLTLFSGPTNLFKTCCRSYGRIQVFTRGQTLLLYAVLIHNILDTSDIGRRLRVIRNLIAASEDEFRPQSMPGLLGDVRTIVVDGDLDSVGSFNQVQLEDERLKREFLAQHPDLELTLFALEDHPLLRGALLAFDLEAESFEARARAFAEVFGSSVDRGVVTGALLATGEYQRPRPRGKGFQFGSSSSDHDGAWRELLTGASRDAVRPTSEVLAMLLDRVYSCDDPAQRCLQDLRHAWLEDREESKLLDWRYYLVKYDFMREGDSGIYRTESDSLGYSMVMLRKEQLNSYYRDPYLYGMYLESGVEDSVQNPWFTGYLSEQRWLKSQRSEAGIRCVPKGLVLYLPSPSRPETERFLDALGLGGQNTLEELEVDEEDAVAFLLPVTQESRHGELIDTEDRVQKGASVLKAMVEAGL